MKSNFPNSRPGHERALACSHCNACKADHIQGFDPTTSENAPLYDPRCEAWDEHFEWNGPGELVGRTPTGRATIAVLRINDPDMVELRRLLNELGLFSANA